MSKIGPTPPPGFDALSVDEQIYYVEMESSMSIDLLRRPTYCSGGFLPRPIRPSTNWNGDNFLGKDPASTKVKHRPGDPAEHERFPAMIKTIPPEER